MKKIKSLLFFGILVFTFSSCSKCMECEGPNGYSHDGENDPYREVCKDNFDSRNDYEDFIVQLEDSNYNCKSDFWN